MNNSRVYIKCPCCGKSSDSRNGRDIIFCSYCGSRLTESPEIVQELIQHDDIMEEMQLEHNQDVKRMWVEHLQDIHMRQMEHKMTIKRERAYRRTNFLQELTWSLGEAFRSIGSGIFRIFRPFLKIIGIIIAAVLCWRLLGFLWRLIH